MPALVQRRAPRAPELDARRVRSIANRMLAELGVPEAELSVLLTDDATIAELNREHRNKDRPTDVLAFPQYEADEAVPEGGAGALLGDVVISLDTAARQAQRRRRSLLDETEFLLAHGLLHLLGWDHRTDAEQREMDAKTRSLLAATKKK